jgi:hypothetical protein
LPDNAVSVIRITEERIGLVRSPGTTLVAEVKGDTPEGRKLIEDLWNKHRDAFPPNQRLHYGPDSGFTQISMRHGPERIVVGSWHTAERTNPRLFASATGLGLLGNRTREQALAAEPVAYQKFRAAFDDILEKVTGFGKKR